MFFVHPPLAPPICTQSWSSWFEPNVEKCGIFEPEIFKSEEKIKLAIVNMRMFDIHNNIWSLGFPFIQ